MSKSKKLSAVLKTPTDVGSLKEAQLLIGNGSGALKGIDGVDLKCLLFFGQRATMNVDRNTEVEHATLMQYSQTGTLFWWTEFKEAIPAGAIVTLSFKVKETGKRFRIYYLAAESTKQHDNIRHRDLITLMSEEEGLPPIFNPNLETLLGRNTATASVLWGGVIHYLSITSNSGEEGGPHESDKEAEREAESTGDGSGLAFGTLDAMCDFCGRACEDGLHRHRPDTEDRGRGRDHVAVRLWADEQLDEHTERRGGNAIHQSTGGIVRLPVLIQVRDGKILFPDKDGELEALEGDSADGSVAERKEVVAV
ncbi:MAG: hypothetical protein HDQ88_02280 [Clostridia bacterium]|nr:hypothetical protein [Clostridia bacterium]